MVDAQVFFDVMEQTPSFITGGLNDIDRQSFRRFSQGLGPGVGCTIFSILFQKNEIGDRFNRHQTSLWMKGLIFTDGNLLGFHSLAQSCFFLLIEFVDGLLQRNRNLPVRTVRSGHEVVQTG